jgi:hypothetical protein
MRNLALFHLPIDDKLRGCDLAIKVEDVALHGHAAALRCRLALVDSALSQQAPSQSAPFVGAKRSFQ